MFKLRGAIVAGLAFVLSSCCLWKPADPGGVLVPANAYGEVPAEAKVVSNRKFLRRVADGKLKVLPPQGDRKAELAQFQSDVQTLQAIPEKDRSPDVRSILEAVTAGVDPLVEPTATANGPNGQTAEYRLLSLAVEARIAVEAERIAVDRDNSLAAYRLTYEAAPPSARQGLPAPDALAGSALAAIEEARAKLGAALSLVPDLGEVRSEESVAHAALAAAAAPEPTPTECGAAVQGNDGTFDCPTSANGIHRRLWWPLKRFVTPIKDQARRGLCWAFAAVAALESRELVVKGETRNLSEQYFNYRWKTTLSPRPTSEGDFPDFALAFLNGFPGAASAIPNENFWLYNPACSRPQMPSPVTPFAFDCKSYLGTCSPTPSEGPMTCTKNPSGDVCGIEIFAVEPAAGVPSMSPVQVWKSGQTLDLDALRALLANGQPLLASLNVYRGFQNPVGGVIDDYADITSAGKKEGGGHDILFVGFVTNDDIGPLLLEKPGLGGGYFIAKNSWGCRGDGGYVYVPAKYVSLFFKRLMASSIPADRSAEWNDAKNAASQAPKLQITKPYLSADVVLSPYRADFSKDIVLTAVANDAQDGANCCADTFKWSFANGVSLGAGGTATLPAIFLDGRKEARVQVVGRDSDGNLAKAVLWLADIEPAIHVVSPLPHQALFTGVEHTFEAKVKAEGLPGDLDCSKLSWHTEPFSGQGAVFGCTPTFKWSFPDNLDLVVEGLHGVHPMKTSVPIRLIVNALGGPPEVAIFPEPNDNASDSSARVRFTILDPGGPGMADLGPYQLTWELEYQGVRKPANAIRFLLQPEVIINTRDTFVPDCSDTSPDFVIHLKVFDPEGLEGNASAQFSYTQTPCIN